MISVSFIFFIVVMLLVGTAATYVSKSTPDDYILAGRDVGYLATALSAVSTCHSGFMFIGMIGFTYRYGISAIWMIFGWLVGDYIAWTFIYPKLREMSESKQSLTISDFVVSHLSSKNKKIIKAYISIIIFIFVGLYASAQLIAGSKALVTFLDISQIWGIIIGGVIVLAYSVSGGIRASIWTDVVQSIIMLIAMLGLLITAVIEIGGIGQLFSTLHQIDPSLTRIFMNVDGAFLMYVLGWCAFGMGVIGQPHILTRPMSISAVSQLKQARSVYFSWYLIFSLSALFVGLAARVILPELISSDTELALPLLATQLLPSFFVGIVLAGIFSACISTADSQILVCSSTITDTFLSKYSHRMLITKFITFFTLVIIILASIIASKSVFFLVIFSWSILALVLTPLIYAQCYSKKYSGNLIHILTISAFVIIFVWVYILKLSNEVNEVLPGFIIMIIIITSYKRFSKFFQKVK